VPEFVPGLDLSGAFYAEVVGPLLETWPHVAARIGAGSDVLGLDTSRSTDHGWRPQVTVFVDSGDVSVVEEAVEAGLPDSFTDWPVRFGWDEAAVSHHVEVTTCSEWCIKQLGVDPAAGLDSTDWLLMPQQKLLETTAGAVFHDPAGTLGRVREQLRWYPDDVWRWILASQWHRVAQEEAFVARAVEVGDELGSRIIIARLARDLMRVWFLLCRAYWPYDKWLGSCFRRLPGNRPLFAALTDAVGCSDHAEREAALQAAFHLAAQGHNRFDPARTVDTEPRLFHTRPWKVLMADRLAEACLAGITDPSLRRLPLVGTVGQAATAPTSSPTPPAPAPYIACTTPTTDQHR